MNDILLLDLAAADVFSCSPFNVNCTLSGWGDSLFRRYMAFFDQKQMIHFNKVHFMLKSAHDTCAFKAVEKDF